MNSASNQLPTPEGPGSVWGAPNLPAGFTDTFTSQYIDTGDVRLHAVIGGAGALDEVHLDADQAAVLAMRSHTCPLNGSPKFSATTPCRCASSWRYASENRRLPQRPGVLSITPSSRLRLASGR